MQPLTFPKLFHCNIHGPIRISNIAMKIIETQEFQRLRNIKQMGASFYVFPSATHSRFEHSIGVYYLTGKLLDVLKSKYPNKIYNTHELNNIMLNDYHTELIKIGGLCHDIGHGPYSHLFDLVMKNCDIGEFDEHENRSCELVKIICQRELNDILSSQHINFICSIINPQNVHTGALYQIVSNYLNGIDVDKFDYLMRDAYNIGFKKSFDSRKIIDEIIIDENNNIVYARHCASEIYDMFHSRYMMHKQVYQHKTVKIIEIMIKDVIIKIDPILKISNKTKNMDEFCKLDDNTIFTLITDAINNPNEYTKDEYNILQDANNLYQNIIKRKFYKCIDDNNNKNKMEKFMIKSNHANDLQIVDTIIGMVSNNTNPFDTTYFYDHKHSNKSFIMNKKDVSMMLTNGKVSEIHYYLICNNNKKYQEILNSYNLFIE